MCVMEEVDGGLMARPPGPERVQWLSDRNLIDLLLLGNGLNIVVIVNPASELNICPSRAGHIHTLYKHCRSKEIHRKKAAEIKRTSC